MHVAVCLYDGFDELDAVGPYEVFARGAEASMRTLDGEMVRAKHGLRVEPDGRLEAIDPDWLLVPGGGWNDRSSAGAWAEYERGRIPEAIRRAADHGTNLAGVCTGTMLLQKAGVLDGRAATTHHGAVDDLRATGVDCRNQRVVDDGSIVTCGGVTAGIDLAFHVLRRECGESVAASVAEAIEYDRS
ncbi:MAG: DJ-1/PfpI family protein [Natronomonas sp.]